VKKHLTGNKKYNILSVLKQKDGLRDDRELRDK